VRSAPSLVNPDDTIVAIATPPGTGALGVIRMSGRDAIPIASTIVRLKGDGLLAIARPRTAHVATLVDPATAEPLDEGVVVAMVAPHSYTGEDTVELSCHGNPVLLAEIVRQLVGHGARLAEPGEFTRRAFLNGRLGLPEAEAVADLIAARTTRAVQLAMRQLRGKLGDEIAALRSRLLDVVAGLEVSLDFPEDSVGLSPRDAACEIRRHQRQLEQMLRGGRRSRLVQTGLTVMLTGAPNVGKSSLLNALLGEERAIVAPTPGTTRDLVEAAVVVEGVPLRLLDGAGLGDALDAIDADGMRRARKAAEDSDLVVVVLDRSRVLSSADRSIIAVTQRRERILVANKADLPAAWKDECACDWECSALTGEGLASLHRAIGEWVKQRITADADEGGIVASVRVLDRMERARALLASAVAALETTALEAVLVELKDAVEELGQILGLPGEDELLDRIFATFCVGK
jgi:tRNA modification GTPase